LDTTSATIFLENGFSYTLSPQFVFKVFGIPFGTKSIEIKTSKECTDQIHEII
jgi:hypothetical protein